MRTGERRASWGFTYLWLLFLLAVAGLALAASGQRWSGVMQRERERELIFRGQQIAAAIEAYHAVPGVAPPQWPHSLGDLVEDRRGPHTLRHLRRVYADPFTGAPDWVPILAEDGRWRGVHSRSQVPASIRLEDSPQPSSRRPMLVSDHRFVALARAAGAVDLLPSPPGNEDKAVPQ